MNLVWFRQDLRIGDNPALFHACQAGEPVMGLYVVSQRQWQQYLIAPLRQQFMLAHVDQLGRSLANLGIPLTVEYLADYGLQQACLPALLRRLGVRQVFANQAIELDEQRRDSALSKDLATAGITCHWFNGCCILPPGSVLTSSGEMFKVFSPFSRAWLKAFVQQPFVLYPEPKARGAALHWLALTDLFTPTLSALSHWPIGETAAAARLQAFLNNDVLDYSNQRDIPATAGTSSLSPYLSAGVISAKQCLAALIARLGYFPSECHEVGFSWLNELIWREFYRHLLALIPALSMGKPFKAHTQGLAWRWDEADFAAWQLGRTGFPIVDAAMRCLNQTGWMHNRLRMIVASFLTKDLQIHWRHGEDYFMSQLIDGDLAANNGGWQWAAGTGADASPYFRVFNPTKQSERFDPDGRFIRTWLPELADVPLKFLHQPYPWLSSQDRSDYPAPIVDHKEARVRAIAMFKGIGG